MNDPETIGASPKRWVVSATATPKQSMTLACAGRPLTQSKTGSVDDVSPVELMLLSIAGCFALSCRAALKARKATPTPVEVTVTGEMAHDAPSRVSRITLAVIFGHGMSSDEAAAIAQDAKRLCTVTNTILGVPGLEVTATGGG